MCTVASRYLLVMGAITIKIFTCKYHLDKGYGYEKLPFVYESDFYTPENLSSFFLVFFNSTKSSPLCHVLSSNLLVKADESSLLFPQF